MIIYKITNIKNGKIYIGLTSQPLKTRFAQHLQNAKEHKDERRLSIAMREFGRSAFRIEEIDFANSWVELCGKEIDWIKKLDSTNPEIGYNMTGGGEFQIYDMEFSLKIMNGIRDSKLNHKRAYSSKYVGVYFVQERKRWSFGITYKGFVKKAKNFVTDRDAAIARDIELLRRLGKSDTFNRLANFPEDIDRYIAGEICYPKREMHRALKKSNFIGVSWDGQNQKWLATILVDKKRFKSPLYNQEKDAAIMFDYLNITKGDSRFPINFPEMDIANHPELLPKGILMSKKAVPHSLISRDKEYFVFTIHQNKKRTRKHFLTLEKAVIFRNNFLKEHNIPIPD